MRALIKSLLALQMTVFAPSAFAGHLQNGGLPPEVIKYIHTQSPQISVDLVGKDNQHQTGIYNFESMVLDLSQVKPDVARSWVLTKYNEIKLQNPSLQTNVLKIVDAKLGRRPAFYRKSSIIVDDVAQILGVKVEEQMAPIDTQPRSADERTPVAIVLLERVNSVVIRLVVIEAKNLGPTLGVSFANTLGSVAGGMPVALPPSTWSAPLKDTFVQGYSELQSETYRLRSPRHSFYTYGYSTRFRQYSNFATEKVRYAKVLGIHATTFQTPLILKWLYTQSYNIHRVVFDIHTSGTAGFISFLARGAWAIAIESEVAYRKDASPELEAKLENAKARTQILLYVFYKSFSAILKTAAITGPEAWIAFAVVGITAVAKIMRDFDRAVREYRRNETNVASESPPPPPAAKPPPVVRRAPIQCKYVFSTHQGNNTTAKVAGL